MTRVRTEPGEVIVVETVATKGRVRRARVLAAGTVGYNTLEGVVAIAAGTVAGSVALLGFGLDSAVEVLSALAVTWQYAPGSDPVARERRALRLIACCFLGLSCYLVLDSARELLEGARPAASPVGIALAVSSLVVMPVLARAKRRTAAELGSVTVRADAAQTQLCAYLSAVLLLGLLTRALLGWTWADPVAGLLIAAVAGREGARAWRGESCCPAPAGPSLDLSSPHVSFQHLVSLPAVTVARVRTDPGCAATCCDSGPPAVIITGGLLSRRDRPPTR